MFKVHWAKLSFEYVCIVLNTEKSSQIDNLALYNYLDGCTFISTYLTLILQLSSLSKMGKPRGF